MNTTNGSLFVDTGMNTPRADAEWIERDAITAVVYNPRTDSVIGLKWKKVDWDTLVTGGVEVGQTAEDAAIVEILQETGYKHLRLMQELPPYHSKFFHHPKGVNRFAHFRCFLFILEDEERDDVAADELEKHDVVWLTRNQLESFRLPEGHRFTIENAYRYL